MPFLAMLSRRFCAKDLATSINGSLGRGRATGYVRLLRKPALAFWHASCSISNAPKLSQPCKTIQFRQYGGDGLRLVSTTSSSEQPSPSPTDYQPPSTGFVARLPSNWIPYAELMRLDKPTGTYYVFFPCLFSTLLASAHIQAAPLQICAITALFFSGAVVMRGAGCTINDLWDRNLDPYVARTKLRPIARGAVTPKQAIVFTGFQLLTGLAILLQFPSACFWYASPSLLFVVTYPLAKRFTDYPQFILGLTFSWGAFLGFPALGYDLLSDVQAMKATVALYTSCVAWTVFYDMIYAHMDIKDDIKVGIRSIARRHEKETKAVLAGLAIMQMSLLGLSGSFLGFHAPFYLISCGLGSVTLGGIINRVDLKSVQNCWFWFRTGAWMTGGVISFGLWTEYCMRRTNSGHGARGEGNRRSGDCTNQRSQLLL
ncbi:Para-hydroxybenzoate--polyprenyltransferase, mitochondrial precursor (PHB:polyprenyltransferase) [Agyrium rufum]|nr:Para-hydroxybenzoate--polyprenyltransferase, mitochondrial precursor (PHB:polyprenyltransferase) [Agyrium rufum]